MRIQYYDAAKAIGIFLVVLGHCYWLGSIPGLNRLIYSFHMPLFFILSGMFIKPLSILSGIKKYGKKYLKPYIITCGLILIIGIVNTGIHGENYAPFLKNWIISTLFASGSNSGDVLLADMPKVGPIWFLFALFWSASIYSFIKFRYDTINSTLLSFFVFALAYISVQYIRLPFSIQAGMGAVPFIMVGDKLRSWKIEDRFYELGEKWCILLMFWLLSVIVYGGINSSVCHYQNGIVTIPVSIIATLFILYLCRRIKISALFGNMTLYILCGHQIFKSFCWQNNFDFSALFRFTPPPCYACLSRYFYNLA